MNENSEHFSELRLLRGKRLLATGAGKGISRACAIEFARQGGRIALCDIDGDAAHATAAAITDAGGEAIAVEADVSSEADVQRFVDVAVETFCGLDGAFNCAGIADNGSAVETSLAEWNRVLSVNVTGMFLVAKHSIPHPCEAGGGSIVNMSSVLNMSSVSAYWGEPGTVANNASKGAVLAMTKAVAQDHGPEGVRVNCRAPGFHDTGMVDDYFDAQPDGDEARKRINQLMAVRRIGDPEALPRTAAFILSDANRYMTAASVVLDGAMSAGYT